jgi:hypothetical protein
VAAAATAEDDGSDISWSSDGPYAPPEEKAAEQMTLVESFETLKDDAANATLRQCLLEDAAAHQALAAARQTA